jgi:tetratricopeptide (TPR) repeat protein
MRKGELDRAVAEFTKAIDINPQLAFLFVNRSLAYTSKGDTDRAIADANKAIEIDPNVAMAYASRSAAHGRSGDMDRALADAVRAVEIDPRLVFGYMARSDAYASRGDTDRALADAIKAVETNPTMVETYSHRAWVHVERGDHDLAIADASKAIEINSRHASAYAVRGAAYLVKGDNDRALADTSKAIELDPRSAYAHVSSGRVYARVVKNDLAIAAYTRGIEIDPKNPEIYVERAAVYETKGLTALAIADYYTALQRPARSVREERAKAQARIRLVGLQKPSSPVAQPGALVGTPGRRVALVIGNSAYGAIERLANPTNDARAVAASFRRLGFAEVIERHDLGLTAMVDAFKTFGDRTADADWAIVYYAGHGIEMGGTTYLIPTDARLLRDAHLPDEALPLDRVLAKVETARKLRLVILDACRNNPFLGRMARAAGGGRGIGRGLARIEPDGGVIVAYAAKHGTIAQDGEGVHSPFTEALLAHLEEPGLEINFLFRKVRDRVLDRTGKVQEPFIYGSLGSEPLYFQVSVSR